MHPGPTETDADLIAAGGIGSARAAIGLVAIGRNEGDRLRRCVESLGGLAAVYVDSGSTDGSVEWVLSQGVDVVSLDLSRPFTAARARNAGFDRLLASHPGLQFVQFVDGDCELAPGWLDAGAAELAARPDVAVVCGWRRERFPDASVYNALCDVEWQAPAGETTWCGGDFLVRAAAFREAGGFDSLVIAGEEPELCFRLRARGWKLLRLPLPMTRHDAALTRFGQWWRRGLRTGHAFAEGAATHGRSPERYCVREVRSGWLWGAILPALALVAAWPTRGISLALLLAYPLLAVKIYRGTRRRFAPKAARRAAVFGIIGKFAQAIGQMKFRWNRLRGRRTRLIEYKHVPRA